MIGRSGSRLAGTRPQRESVAISPSAKRNIIPPRGYFNAMWMWGVRPKIGTAGVLFWTMRFGISDPGGKIKLFVREKTPPAGLKKAIKPQQFHPT